MNWTLEVVMVPVTDLDRAKAFYAEKLAFPLDHDTRTGPDTGFVQLTPAGSGCSVVLSNQAEMPPGSLSGVQLVVADLPAARRQLVDRGVDVSEIFVFGTEGPRPRKDDENLDNVGFISFQDPDGNKWAVQQISRRG